MRWVRKHLFGIGVAVGVVLLILAWAYQSKACHSRGGVMVPVPGTDRNGVPQYACVKEGTFGIINPFGGS